MIASIELEQIDEILDQLESLSRTAQSKREFYEAVLNRLQMLLQAQTVSYLVRVGSQVAHQNWSTLAVVGDLQAPQEIGSLCNSLEIDRPWQLSTDCRLLVVSSGFKLGQPDSAIAARLANPIDSTAAQELVRLMQAFAEIVDLRNQREKELFFKHHFPRFQSSLSVLARSTDSLQAAIIIANELQDVLAADRVSLAQSKSNRPPQLLSVSGVAGKILPTETSTELLRICREIDNAGRPILRTPQSDNGELKFTEQEHGRVLAPFLAAFPLNSTEFQCNSDRPETHTATNNSDQTYVVFEWSDGEKFLSGLSVMSHVLPTLAPLWQAQSRWLRQPTILRHLGSSTDLLKRTVNRWAARTLIAAAVLSLIAWVLTRPVDFRIEMLGTLEPAAQQTIYASHDGYIDQLLVDDNSQVHQGQSLAVMRSPELELQIQEVKGQLLANQEKRLALSLSLNQIGETQSADNQAKQQSVGSEIRQVDIQQQSLEQRLEALVAESEKLTLTSPIRGIVISHEITRTLESRPIRRGDAILRVADPSASWRLSLRIKDTDVGHVKKQLAHDSNSATMEDNQIEFVLVSHPSDKHHAKLTWIANHARNPDGLGVIVDAHAQIEQSIEMTQVSSTVQAYLTCGQRPLWYVWSRPLRETIQRKLWF